MITIKPPFWALQFSYLLVDEAQRPKPGLENCKESQSQYFRGFESYGLSGTHLTAAEELLCGSRDRAGEWAWPLSNKSLFTDTAIGISCNFCTSPNVLFIFFHDFKNRKTILSPWAL